MASKACRLCFHFCHLTCFLLNCAYRSAIYLLAFVLCTSCRLERGLVSWLIHALLMLVFYSVVLSAVDTCRCLQVDYEIEPVVAVRSWKSIPDQNVSGHATPMLHPRTHLATVVHDTRAFLPSVLQRRNPSNSLRRKE
ncbi:hypothetical protein F5I97DRAFT_604716 [Phlebopus sp. FC_14]|nr:hypothetical protein F5I97DRAFT_604716 [Phlebopus sp. FC_14]